MKDVGEERKETRQNNGFFFLPEIEVWLNYTEQDYYKFLYELFVGKTEN